MHRHNHPSQIVVCVHLMHNTPFNSSLKTTAPLTGGMCTLHSLRNCIVHDFTLVYTRILRILFI